MLPLLLVISLASAPAQADEPPIALAGRAFLAYPGEHIILDGSQSYDPEGYELTWSWSQVGGPPVELVLADTPNPEFDLLEAGVHSFELVVDDGLQPSQPDVVDVVAVDPAIVPRRGGCSAIPVAPAAGMLLPLLALLRRRAR